MEYPKRLIEVDLPIARISAHARREKSIRRRRIVDQLTALDARQYYRWPEGTQEE